MAPGKATEIWTHLHGNGGVETSLDLPRLFLPGINDRMGLVSSRLIEIFERERNRKVINIDDVYRALRKSEEDARAGEKKQSLSERMLLNRGESREKLEIPGNRIDRANVCGPKSAIPRNFLFPIFNLDFQLISN